VGGLLARLQPSDTSPELGDFPPFHRARTRIWWDGVTVSEFTPEMLERWSYHLALFESGGLAVHRVYASKKSDARH
jgi:hypothetical protein